MSGRIIKKAKLGPPPFDLICEHNTHPVTTTTKSMMFHMFLR